MYVILVFVLAIPVFGSPRLLQSIQEAGTNAVWQNATATEFPYQAAVVNNWEHSCGASLLNSKYALSAAHCVEGAAAANIRVIAGLNVRGNMLMEAQIQQVKKISVHPEFNQVTFENDIAILEFSGDFTFNEYVQPIPVLKTCISFPAFVLVSEWRLTNEGGSSEYILQKATVPIMPDDACSDAYSPDYKIPDTMFCAWEEDTCAGDSGGSAVTLLATTPSLVGIKSRGIGCSRFGFPVLYTEVCHFEPWIAQIITG